MPLPDILTVCKEHLFDDADKLLETYPERLVTRVTRLRDMYQWQIAHPEAKDRQFVAELLSRYQVSKIIAYRDLSVIKALLPALSTASREFHRWRYNEMILETYEMAKARKDTKTMEKAAASYAKYNRVDVEEEQVITYELVAIQPFTATGDPRVLGIKPIPNIEDKISAMIEKYRRETVDIEDVDFEPADLEEDVLFPAPKDAGAEPLEELI